MDDNPLTPTTPEPNTPTSTSPLTEVPPSTTPIQPLIEITPPKNEPVTPPSPPPVTHEIPPVSKLAPIYPPSPTPEVIPPSETTLSPVTPPPVRLEPTPEIVEPPITPTPMPLEIAPEEPKGRGWLITITISLLLIIGLVALIIFLLTRRAPGTSQPLPTRGGVPVISPTLTPTPLVAKTLTFENDFIKFSYPDTLRQVPIGNDYNFNFYENNVPTGNFISYSMSNLRNQTLENWVIRNEKCGTTQTRKPVPFSANQTIQGFEIMNLGACPTGGTSIVDVYYFTTGQTVHRLALQAGKQTEVSQKERTTLTTLLNSITLVTITRGIK